MNAERARGPEPEPQRGVRATRWLLAGIVALGAAARFWNLDWDRGAYHLHPDEWALNEVVRNLGPDLNPHFFFYGSLPIYLYRATAWLLSALTGVEWLDTARVSLVGRFYSALASTAMLPFIYLAGRRLWGRGAGLIATAFAASAPLLIQAAHFGTVDSLVALTGVVILFLSLRMVDGGGLRLYALCGVILGLALGVKLTAGLFAVMPITAHLFCLRGLSSRGRVRPFAVFVSSAAVATMVASPYYLLAWPEFWRAVEEQWTELSGGYRLAYTWQFSGTTPYLFEASNLVVWGLGVGAGVPGFAGWLLFLLRAARQRLREPGLLVLLAWPTLYFVYIGTWEARFVRHTLPLVPFLCLFGAGLAHVVAVSRWRGRGRVFTRALAGVSLAGAAAWGMAFISIYATTDTRLAATEWIRANIASGAHLVVEDDNTLLPLFDEAHPPELYRYEVVEPTAPDTPAKAEAMAASLSRGEVLIISSRRWSAVLPRRLEFPLMARYYRLLEEGRLGYSPLSTFASPPRLGPFLFYDDAAEETFQVFDHPTVRLYRNTGRLTQTEIGALLGGRR